MIQGVYHSDTRRSTRVAYFGITPDFNEVFVLTIVLMSAVNEGQVLQESIFIKMLHLPGFDDFVLSL